MVLMAIVVGLVAAINNITGHITYALVTVTTQ